MFNIIVCMDQNYSIGCNGKLLYHIKEDLVRFKDLTMNSVVIMGSKTLLSLPNSQPLKYRRNIVLTNNKELSKKYPKFTLSSTNPILFTDDFEKIIKKYKYIEQQLWIIGGASIYKQFEEHCARLFITDVITRHPKEADTFFKPNFDLWVLEEQSDSFVLNSNTMYNYKTYYNPNIIKGGNLIEEEGEDSCTSA